MPFLMGSPLANADSLDDASGDDAFGRMLVAMQSRLRGFLRKLGPCDVDDLAQETIARAWRSRASFDASRGKPVSWLLRIALRVYLDQRGSSQPTQGLIPDPREKSPGPFETAAARDRIQELLGKLSDREREVLLKFHRNGESISAIAKAMALPEGTVKSHLHRARARLWDLDVGADEREDR